MLKKLLFIFILIAASAISCSENIINPNCDHVFMNKLLYNSKQYDYNLLPHSSSFTIRFMNKSSRDEFCRFLNKTGESFPGLLGVGEDKFLTFLTTKAISSNALGHYLQSICYVLGIYRYSYVWFRI